ncbi:MAG: hypothetical protein PHC28_10060 [Flavobacterium sp.]|uniref:hypothetical protein n=1 Tax=Flavobacterium sp. TaxID=239 RepID=UPI002623A1F0|nr:hypothetical protein [Flavobacterium sp.]MDD5150801.1 hypothetical protein [Flavobacterium sp.]
MKKTTYYSLKEYNIFVSKSLTFFGFSQNSIYTNPANNRSSTLALTFPTVTTTLIVENQISGGSNIGISFTSTIQNLQVEYKVGKVTLLNSIGQTFGTLKIKNQEQQNIR